MTSATSRSDLKTYFEENREDFKNYLRKTRNVSERREKDYINSISNHLVDEIYTTRELKKHLETVYTDSYAKALRNLVNYWEYMEISSFNDISLDQWRKAIKIKPSGVREIFVSDQEIKEAYEHVDNKLLFRVLIFSGMRLAQITRGIKDIDKAVIFESFFRIPLGSSSKGHKKGFWLYLPIELKKELENNNNFSYNPKMLRYKRVNANTIRKWNLNKLLELDVPMDVINFLQGRASDNVGSTHYMNHTKAADREYARIIPIYSQWL